MGALLLCSSAATVAAEPYEPPPLPGWPRFLPDPRVEKDGTVCLPVALADATAHYIARIEANRGISVVRFAGLRDTHAAELRAQEQVLLARTDLLIEEAGASDWWARLLFGAGGVLLATVAALLPR